MVKTNKINARKIYFIGYSLFSAISILCYITLPIPPLLAQNTGNHFIQSFPPSLYQAHTQNWALEQDEAGRIYAGNNFGVLIYDGIDWQLIPVDNHTTVRCLAYHPKEKRIYVGAQGGEMGYLDENLQGSPKYASLTSHVDSTLLPKLGDIWEVHYHKEKIYYRTTSHLLSVDSEHNISYLKASHSYHRSYSFNERLFILEDSVGLLELNNDSLQLVKGGEEFANNRIYSLLPYSKDQFLISTRLGFFLLNWVTGELNIFQAEKWVHELIVYNGIKMANGFFAYTTLGNGVIVIDKQGNVQNQYNKENGLLDNIAINIKEDRQKGLWVGLNNGISRIEAQSPISFWTEKDGLELGINSILRFDGKLYVGTDIGLFQYDGNGRFTIPDPSFADLQVWHLYPFKLPNNQEILTVASSDGVFYLKNKKLEKINHATGFEIKQGRKRSEYLYIGAENGLLVVKYANGKFTTLGYAKQATATIRSVYVDEHEKIWVSTAHDGILVLELQADTSAMPTFTYTTIDTLPKLTNLKDIYIYEINKKVHIATTQGLYKFDSLGKEWVPSNLLGNQYKGGQPNSLDVYRMSQKSNGDICVVGTSSDISPLSIFSSSGEVSANSAYLNRLPTQAVQCIFHENDSITWVGSASGIFRYQQPKDKLLTPNRPLINKVFIAEDSLIFGGYTQQANRISLPYEYNSITFLMGAPCYDGAEQNLFSHQLFPYEKHWSRWTKDSKKEYTNLPEGHYEFRVKILDAYSQESQITSYKFRIHPPWYRTTVAYFFYLLFFILLIWLSARIYSRKLRNEKIQLEQTVEERTKEISLQKDAILSKNTELEQRNEEITAQRDLLNAQNAEIRKQHQQISASINYAERIQRAMLPTSKQTQEIWNNSFVLFKPKNIVSGDFYWFGEVEGKKVIAAVDCTGHGVPGALMSMIGEALLSQAVIERKISSPKKILHYMNIGVQRILKQEESSNRDGMDMSICIIDSATGQASIAGARNPVIHIRGGAVSIIKGTKRSIGGKNQQKAPNFQEESLILEKGDLLYLFSDGYIDQFGGPNNRKLMKKGFQETLQKIASMPLNTQQNYLEEFLNQWMNESNQQQVDDILVIGLQY